MFAHFWLCQQLGSQFLIKLDKIVKSNFLLNKKPKIYNLSFQGLKLYGDHCRSNNDCSSSGNYICNLNKCSCSTTTWLSNGQCCINNIHYNNFNNALF